MSHLTKIVEMCLARFNYGSHVSGRRLDRTSTQEHTCVHVINNPSVSSADRGSRQGARYSNAAYRKFLANAAIRV